MAWKYVKSKRSSRVAFTNAGPSSDPAPPSGHIHGWRVYWQ
jgi:hypothetical protein